MAQSLRAMLRWHISITIWRTMTMATDDTTGDDVFVENRLCTTSKWILYSGHIHVSRISASKIGGRGKLARSGLLLSCSTSINSRVGLHTHTHTPKHKHTRVSRVPVNHASRVVWHRAECTNNKTYTYLNFTLTTHNGHQRICIHDMHIHSAVAAILWHSTWRICILRNVWQTYIHTRWNSTPPCVCVFLGRYVWHLTRTGRMRKKVKHMRTVFVRRTQLWRSCLVGVCANYEEQWQSDSGLRVPTCAHVQLY